MPEDPDLTAWRSWHEKGVPLSAIRALVQQWRERLRVESDECPDSELTLQRCVEELAALCPAPPEDRNGR